MKKITYRGSVIVQQKEFGPLRLLQWVDFIIVKDNANAIPGMTFHTDSEAKKVIDIQLEAFRAFAAGRLGAS